MPLIQAVYEHGVFRPTEPIELPNGCGVNVMCPVLAGSNESNRAFPNERRVQLIRKQFAEGLSEAESEELQDLQEQSLQLLEKWDAALLANVDHMQAAVDEVVQAAKTST